MNPRNPRKPQIVPRWKPLLISLLLVAVLMLPAVHFAKPAVVRWYQIRQLTSADLAKREAALNASHIFFSIAGIDDDMLKKYERYGNFQKAYANMKALVDYRNARGLSRPQIEWKYLLFNWNDRRATLERAIEMARAAGVDAISFWPTSNPAYGYSFRYRLGLMNHIGVANWKGRELDLRAAPKEPLTL